MNEKITRIALLLFTIGFFIGGGFSFFITKRIYTDPSMVVDMAVALKVDTLHSKIK